MPVCKKFCLHFSRAASLLMILAYAAWVAGEAPSPLPDAQLTRQVDLSKLGFQGLSPESRFLTTANISVNFLDNDHVLFTFNPKKLFQRLPDCPPSHKDRIIQARVIELSTGKVVRETSWYLHDERRYVWPLGEDRFLLRIQNKLYELDSRLRQKLLLDSPRPLLFISVTPDGKQIIAETSVEEQSRSKAASAKAKVKIEFLDAQSLAVQRTIRLSQVTPLNATSLGFADAVHNVTGKLWLVRFGPDAKQRSYITRVRSKCIPDLLFPTNNTMFVGRCSAAGTDYSVSVFSVTGHFLWREKWNQYRYEPVLERSEDASRIAISTIESAPGAALPQTELDEEHWPQVEQNIRVVDAATGISLLNTKTQAVLKGQNFGLSPDGTQLAALNGTSLEIFALRPMTAEERAKYLAVQADAPALAAPVARTSADGSGRGEDDVDFDVASRTEESEAKTPPIAPPNLSSQGTPPATDTQQQAIAAQPASVNKSADNSSTITFKASVKTVVVDVVVTDSKGHPIKGMASQDFQVQEDGKPQKINYFHEYKGYASSGLRQDAPTSPETKLPPNVFTNNQLSREDEPVTVLLLDLLNTPPEAQSFARAQLIEFLKNKPKGSQFALCTLSNSLKLIQGFTTDEQLLVATVNGKKGAVRYAPLHERNGGLDIGMQMQKDVAAFDPNKQFVVQMFQEAEAEERAQELERRVWITVDGFAQLARYLSGVPGRKNVVWMSASFPLGIFPNSDLFNAFNATRNYSELMKKTANLLADAHVAVYPVDVRGLMTQSVFSASSTASPIAVQPGSLAPTGGNNVAASIANTAANVPGVSQLNQASHESLEQQVGDQSTMDQIAQDTGGKAFYNTNGIKEALQIAAEQGSEYYMLSYTPTNHNYDGKLRKIKISLASKGHHLAYRHGYFADDPLAPVKEEKDALSRDVGLAAMQHGSPQSHQIVFATRVVPVGKPTRVDPAKLVSDRKTRKNKLPSISEVQHYAVDFAIAAPQLHFTSDGDSHHGVLAFMASAFDDDGRALARLATRTTADLKPSSYQDVMVGGFRIRQEFDVPTSSATLRLGVEDELTRNLGTVEISLPVPAPPDEPSTAKARALPEIEPD